MTFEEFCEINKYPKPTKDQIELVGSLKDGKDTKLMIIMKPRQLGLTTFNRAVRGYLKNNS